MATLLPPEVCEENPSRAEKKIFETFQQLEHDCLVFHSLGLAEHTGKVFGEIDFVVITYQGILCLEVKGGRVERKDGLWHYIDGSDSSHTDPEGPFKQIIGAMHSLRDYVGEQVNRSHSLYTCQYACGVMFPDIVFDQQGPEIISEVIFDSRDTYSPERLKEYVEGCLDYWRQRIKDKHNIETGYLNDYDLRAARRLLRGNFGFVPSLQAEIENVDRELITLTEEQYRNLSMLSSNDRMIIKGGAGTGKTLLGIEQAKRFFVQKKRVLFLFFNKLITRNVSRKFDEEEREYIDVYNFHRLIYQIVDDCVGVEHELNHEFFNEILPEKFLDCIPFTEMQNHYDAVIIDEGQDLIKPNFLLCVDEFLQGGLSEGNWVVFYDPAQNIYNKQFDGGLEFLEENNPTFFELEINCRNTEEIGNYNTSLTEFSRGEDYRVSGGEVVTESYSGKEQLQKKVYKTVKELLQKDIMPGDIVILSPHSLENSFLEDENIFAGLCKFVDITDEMEHYTSDDRLKFSTVQSFKGLESRIVILAGVEGIERDYDRLINYTAISRARIRLYFFYNESIAGEVKKALAQI